MEYFEGTVESIVFYSPDTGYTVCKFSLEDGQTMTVVGSFPPLSPGEMLKIKGKWEINPRFGQQFRVENFLPILPASAKGIEKFLSSGLIRGVGPVLARRIIKKFGAETIDIISKKPDKLKQVEGVGEVKLKEIKKSWAENQNIRDLIIFLQEHNVSTNLATKIYHQYGEKSFQVLKTNPYQVCLDIWGVGFRTADQMALKLGMSSSSPERIKAFVLYLMEKDNEQGHVFSLQSKLEKNCIKELEIEKEKVKDAIEKLKKQKSAITEKIGSDTALYLPFFHQAEGEVAHSIHKLASFPFLTPDFDLDKAISEVEEELGLEFSATQKLAIKECFGKKLLIITGGPGTGKTTIIKAVVDIFHRWEKQVVLAAPTGRAAKRLSEATEREAKTIHRALEYNPKMGVFRRSEKYPLTGDVLIIDEFSMVDLPLMFHLLKAVPNWMRLILVGDKDQLPSVGPGNLLRDIIDSKKVEVVRLDEIFRQAKDSLIVQNAHRVNHGQSLIKPDKGDRDADFYFISQNDEQKVFDTIMNLCTSRIPDKLNLKPISPQIQVISPMYRGLVGVDNLNRELQQRLNPSQEGLKFGNRLIKVHDKVMQVRNNYDKEVFNGDIGLVSHVDRQKYRVEVDFYGRPVFYEKEEMDDLTLAYAVSVHKSQGSEYLSVVMPLLTQHYIMLQRNLFYTALTRAKKLSVIVGSYKALYIAIKNDQQVKRNCLIKEKLIKASEGKGR
ncbi:MAG: ATP-dependent RecD-like DNA helicase [Candidatus Aminicenantes bacterium]|nr:MAG: ATP-dependent RecD-like DNA helicase [Candidatus Aminicenantes bacterium]